MYVDRVVGLEKVVGGQNLQKDLLFISIVGSVPRLCRPHVHLTKR
jgi:hypothetical protein